MSFKPDNSRVRVTFGSKTITDNLSGIMDSVEIRVGSSASTGSYSITTFATGVDGQVANQTVTVNLK